MDDTSIVASERAPSLESLIAKHRASARYGIYRNRLADDACRHLREDLPYRGLTYDEAIEIRNRLDAEARTAAGNPLSSWGLTMHFLRLEKPTAAVIDNRG
jgi:hypothetical protein